jgi:hypothetical protein
MYLSNQGLNAEKMVQRACTGVLVACANHTQNQDRCVDQGTIDVVLSMMRRFSYSSSVQASACMALNIIASNHTRNAAKIRELGGLDLIQRACGM